MLRYPDDLPNVLANYEARLKELERRLPALNDSPEPLDVCCDTYCKFQSGSTTLAAGQSNNTAVTLTIPRPTSGRMYIIGSWQAEHDVVGTAAFYTRTQFEIGGTRYFPIRRWRYTGSGDGDMQGPVVHTVFDFHAGADLAVALYVQNLSANNVFMSDGHMAVIMRGRGGSAACNPTSSGTG